MKRSGKPPFKSFWLLPLILLILFTGGALYVNDYYHADPFALEILSEDITGISVSKTSDRIVFRPEATTTGLIFYPGGKVEFTAYAPLMKALAEKGILCVLLKMPLNLAFLDVNAADAVYSDFPEVESWYLAGHSLGGVAASMYAEKHTDRLDGLVLLAAYSAANLKETGLKVFSIYGSEDGVLNKNEYEKNRANLPDGLTEVIIPGGCHAYFGSYGEQKGNGSPTITREDQLQITADEMSQWGRKGHTKVAYKRYLKQKSATFVLPIFAFYVSDQKVTDTESIPRNGIDSFIYIPNLFPD